MDRETVVFEEEELEIPARAASAAHSADHTSTLLAERSTVHETDLLDLGISGVPEAPAPATGGMLDLDDLLGGSTMTQMVSSTIDQGS